MIGFGSRPAAFLLAATISIVTTAFLTLINDTSIPILFVAAAISFSSTFLLSYLTLEFLIFKEIKDIYDLLEKVKSDEDIKLDQQKRRSGGNRNPFKRINAEITQFATNKQEEIDSLKRSDEYRREFLADVSHELKTPIFAAQGFIYTLLDGAVDDKRVRMKFLKKAAKSLDGLDRLVKDLLTVSQMETGAVTMQMENFDIRALSYEVIDQLDHKARKSSASLNITTDIDSPVFVYADRGRITQVLTNLIENAIKYGREIDGIVTLSFKSKEDAVEVSVRDNGVGIPQEHLNRVFERFYMVDKSRNKSMAKKGSGLGLAIVKHIIEAHETEVQVESKIGIGTVFSFNLAKGAVSREKTLEEVDED